MRAGLPRTEGFPPRLLPRRLRFLRAPRCAASPTLYDVWSVEQCVLELLSLVHGLEPAAQQELLVVALEVLNDPLIHWLRMGCRVGWEEDLLDVVQLELARVAREVIETEQHSASLLAESSVSRTQHLEKLCCHRRL